MLVLCHNEALNNGSKKNHVVYRQMQIAIITPKWRENGIKRTKITTISTTTTTTTKNVRELKQEQCLHCTTKKTSEQKMRLFQITSNIGLRGLITTSYAATNGIMHTNNFDIFQWYSNIVAITCRACASGAKANGPASQHHQQKNQATTTGSNIKLTAGRIPIGFKLSNCSMS